MSKHLSTAELVAQLKKPGPALRTPRVDRMTPPLAEMAMEVTLDQVRPYDRNPRTERNPKYDEIKESIRQVGLKQPPPITQRPGDDKFMISDGGNTRLQILNELYQETGDQKYFTFWCVYRPWVSEVTALAGHLSENENRSDLTWIEKALGVAELKRMLEEDTDADISQRELARRFGELGFSVSQSHISRMLYTVEHFWPTLPTTLKAGLGQPQIKKLIAYRGACLEIWRRADAKPEAEFDPAWHEVIGQFDYEEQTELPWGIVEDRLLGMLEDHTGAHLHTLDWCLKRIFECNKRRESIDDPDIWNPLLAEMERVRNPDAAPLKFYPPRPGEEEEPQRRERKPRASSEPTLEPPGDRTNDQDSEAARLRAELEQLRATHEQLLQQQTIQVTSRPFAQGNIKDTDESGSDDPLEDSESFGEAGEEAPFSFHSESVDIRTDEQRLSDLTLSPVTETESKRQMRHAISALHGGEAGDFADFAVKAIPLMSAGPLTPITDIWFIDAHAQKPETLRYQICRMAQAIGQWAGFPIADSNDVLAPIDLNQTSGIGFDLGPLPPALESEPRAQRVWQLLASLSGDMQPLYPDITLLGTVLGTVSDEDPMPDEVLVRLFRLIRLARVLRTLDHSGEIR